MEDECERGVFRVLFSDTSGYKVSLIMPFDCNRELFAAEKTQFDAFMCKLRYSLISFQMSLFNTLSDAPESSKKKSISRCDGEIVFV